jgi:hypothetical protein
MQALIRRVIRNIWPPLRIEHYKWEEIYTSYEIPEDLKRDLELLWDGGEATHPDLQVYAKLRKALEREKALFDSMRPVGIRNSMVREFWNQVRLFFDIDEVTSVDGFHIVLGVRPLEDKEVDEAVAYISGIHYFRVCVYKHTTGTKVYRSVDVVVAM